MSRIGTKLLFPSLILGTFGISDGSVKDLAKARYSAGKESMRLIKRKFCSGDRSEALYTLKREEFFAHTTTPILRKKKSRIDLVFEVSSLI